MKLKTEKLDDLLTLEEQNQMLEDLMLMEALIIGHQEYLRKIGKLNEGKKFVKEFVDNLSNDDFKKHMEKH